MSYDPYRPINRPQPIRQARAEVPPAPAPAAPAPQVSAGPGRNRVQAVADVPTLQWANGKVQGRPLGLSRFAPFVGFHAEAARDAELDAAMQAAGVAQIDIKHQRPGGAEIVRHWSLGEQITLFPVTSGPIAATISGSLREARATADAGLGLRWSTGERSRLAVRGYLEVLARAGHLALVQLTVRSRMTDVLLSALLDHGRVCEQADHLVDRAKHPAVVTYHEVALPLGPGSEQEWGAGDTATVVPFVSGHPQQVDAAYLRTRWRPERVHAAAEGAWVGVQDWAAGYAGEA